MKHSDFSEILAAIRKTEVAEFRDALLQHRGTYYFLNPDDIMRQDFEGDDDSCPHVYVTGGSNVSGCHELIVHYVEFNDETHEMKVRGRAFYENQLSSSEEWQVEQGSWLDMMDMMEDPGE